MTESHDNNTPLLNKIERYLQQRQALGGNLAYLEPVKVQHSSDATGDIVSREEISHDVTLQNLAISQQSEQQVNIPSNTPPTSSLPTSFPPTSFPPTSVPAIHLSNETLFAESSIPQKTAMATTPSTTVNPAWRDASSLTVLYNHIHTCLNCKLGATRTNFVFGVGNPNADLLVIGEAPGADEDAQGEPFVGRGGQLLTKILEAVNFSREEVYIANIIKCRPPENRRPEADEVEQCEPYLYKQIELIQPKLILALGLTAVNTLLKSKHTMGAIRGKTLEYRGIPLIATYHPAALLRNPEWKRATWEDIQLVRKMYDNLTGKSQ